MINKIKNYIFLNQRKSFFYFLLFVYTLFLIWFSFNDIFVWWDASVYIGMGKYITSGGSLGMWEIFRPPLLPLIYSFLFKLNIPLVFAGKVIVIISSVVSVWVVYFITEFIRKDAGIFAGIFLMVTPIFFLYSRIPMTDIISISIVLLSILSFIKEKYFLTGLFVAIAFLFRFPQGLIFVPIIIACIYYSYEDSFIIWAKKSFTKLIYVSFGFLILVIPYLISNELLYGNFFKPLILASQAVSLSSELYDMGLFYYPQALFKIAPFLFISLLIPFVFINKRFLMSIKQKKDLFFVLIITIVIISYFLLQTHKELRYSLSFIPYLAILSGISFWVILKFIKKEKLVLIFLTFGIMFSLYFSSFEYKNDSNYDYVPTIVYMDNLKGKYLSTTPLPVVFGEIHILSLFERASGFDDLFNKNIELLDGVIIKDCDLFCAEKSITGICYNDLEIITNIIKNASFKKNYETIIDRCTFSIYNK